MFYVVAKNCAHVLLSVLLNEQNTPCLVEMVAKDAQFLGNAANVQLSV